MKRMSSRDLTLYLLVILLMVFAVTSLQQMNRTEAPTYSQIRSYFLQEQVQSFTLKDNTLRLTLRGEGDQTTTVTYEMSDQALTYFYMDMRELIDDQLAAGILESYDYPPGLANSWWYNWLPSLIVLLSVGFLLFVLYRQRMASMGGGGGAPGASRFGHARTKTLSDQGKKVTFDDVAGAEEEKEELQEIVEIHRSGGPHPQGRAAGGPSGHRQDFDCQSCGRRGGGPLPVHLRLRLCRAVCGCGRQPGPGPVRSGKERRPRHRLY